MSFGMTSSMSMRRQLLLGILLPLLVLVGVNAWSLYQEALNASDIAYDRSLLASAKTISEQLGVVGYDNDAQIRALVPYAATEAFETDNQSRLYYKVSHLNGTVVSGFAELPTWKGQIPAKPAYAALVDFYNDKYQGEEVRVATLLQPVVSENGRAMAVIQVAETLELRHTLARELLFGTLWRQALLLGIIALVVVGVVQRATQPVRDLSEHLENRSEHDLAPLAYADAPQEIQPLILATNHVMQKLQSLLQQQKGFVRDAAHQLRTPLAVLKLQVQSAQRGDTPGEQSLQDIALTIDRATQLINQMLALAKVEQQTSSQPSRTDFSQVARDVALELAPLMVAKGLDFELDTQVSGVLAPDWMLRELSRNLLSNAIRHSPQGGRLKLSVQPSQDTVTFSLKDEGPGLSDDLQSKLFQPFATGDTRQGSGLGLSICLGIVQSLQGEIKLRNEPMAGALSGLNCEVQFKRAD
jgi:two-component system sensor histidine kinase TctE